MDEREELAQLRRMAELEAKANDYAKTAKRKEDASAYAGSNAPEGDVGAMGNIMRGLGGAKHAWDRAALGLKGMVTDLSPEDVAQLQQGKAFVDEGGKSAKVGEFGGDVALTVAPAAFGGGLTAVGGRVLPKALAAAPRLAGAVRAALPWVGASGTGAAIGAATNPLDRTGGAVGGAIGGALGEGAGRVLSRTLGGVAAPSVTADARAMMDDGVRVPMWKALEEGSPVRNMSERVRSLPVVGPLMKSQEAAAIRDYNRNLIRDATPPIPRFDEARGVLRWEAPRTAPVGDIGQQGMRELHGRFNQAYDAVYRGRTIPVDDTFEASLRGIGEEASNYTPGAAADINGLIRRVGDTLRAGTETTTTRSAILDAAGNPITTQQLGHAGVPPQQVKNAINIADAAVTDAWRAGDATKARAYEAVRDSLQGLRERGLPPEVQQMLAPVNQAYGNYKLLQRAGSSVGAMRREGVVTPAQMTSAIRALDKSPGKSATAMGTARGQMPAQQANRVLGSELPEVGPGTAEKMALLTGVAGLGWAAPGALGGAAFLTPQGQRLLMGGYGWQSGVRNSGSEIADVMRSMGIASQDKD